MKNLFTVLVVVFITGFTQAQEEHIKQLRLILESANTNFVNEVDVLIGTDNGATLHKTKMKDELGESFIMDFPAENSNKMSRNYIIRYRKKVDPNAAFQSVSDLRYTLGKLSAKEKIAELVEMVKAGKLTVKPDYENQGSMVTDWYNENNSIAVRFASSEYLKTFIFYSVTK